MRTRAATGPADPGRPRDPQPQHPVPHAVAERADERDLHHEEDHQGRERRQLREHGLADEQREQPVDPQGETPPGHRRDRAAAVPRSAEALSGEVLRRGLGTTWPAQPAAERGPALLVRHAPSLRRRGTEPSVAPVAEVRHRLPEVGVAHAVTGPAHVIWS